MSEHEANEIAHQAGRVVDEYPTQRIAARLPTTGTADRREAVKMRKDDKIRAASPRTDLPHVHDAGRHAELTQPLEQGSECPAEIRMGSGGLRLCTVEAHRPMVAA
jgi:hypothetical protein